VRSIFASVKLDHLKIEVDLPMTSIGFPDSQWCVAKRPKLCDGVRPNVSVTPPSSVVAPMNGLFQ
jgi:hypothetical protein